jgi:hypothetical protein
MHVRRIGRGGQAALMSEDVALLGATARRGVHALSVQAMNLDGKRDSSTSGMFADPLPGDGDSSGNMAYLLQPLRQWRDFASRRAQCGAAAS